MQPFSKIYVAGHRGLVGSSIMRVLKKEGHTRILTKTHDELDLLDQSEVNRFFKENQPEYVFLCAAKAGGIHYNNSFQADFLYENLMIACNVIHAASKYGAEKLLFLGSSCIYPKFAEQPIHEDALLTGALEPTNEGYGIAKIAGLKLCEKYMMQYKKRFISVMPTNLYGPNDNFHPEYSHVIPGLIRRFHEAKIAKTEKVIVWGSGKPLREFLYIDDLAQGVYLAMQKYEEPQTINIGYGSDLPIAEVAALVKEVTGFEGRIEFDSSKPDGTPRKFLDSGRIRALGFRPEITLHEGIRRSYQWALENIF